MINLKREIPLHLMLIIPVIIVLIYCYLPMLGIIIAFQDFYPSTRGFVHAIFNSKFIGFDVFKYVFGMHDFYKVVWNTLYIAFMKIITKLTIPLIFALLLNEVSKKWFKKAVQTITYLPYFLSWVVLGGIFLDFFSPQDGAVALIFDSLGLKMPYIFGNAKLFPYTIVATDLWKEAGFNTIVYLAALTGIDVSLYEAAKVDGAGRWKQTIHITIPSIAPIVVLVAILSLGNILNAGFNQIFNLYSPVVYSTGDIIDTFVFRAGLQNGQFSIATAVGLFKSLVSMIMITFSYWLAYKYSDYRVF